MRPREIRKHVEQLFPDEVFGESEIAFGIDFGGGISRHECSGISYSLQYRSQVRWVQRLDSRGSQRG